MSRDLHQQARELLAQGDSLSPAQQIWLQSHLEQCPACQEFAAAANRAFAALRSVQFTADARLVRATQMRVRFHAARLRHTRERLWLVGIACFAVGLTATLSLPLLWRLSAWLGEWAGVSQPVWQVGFAFFCVAPAIFVGVLLLARGTHLAAPGDRPR